jgi:UDPglucose 6-dehydrogenase
MKICVFGLWHLGLVTSACLANKGFDVVGLDLSEDVIYNLNVTDISIPLSEPKLLETIHDCMLRRKLRFTNDIKDAVKDADIVWVTFDTPVDDNDKADTRYVEDQIRSIFPYLKNTTVLISSQLPVGSTTKLSNEFNKYFSSFNVEFAYSPENLRLGKAIEVFNNPERIIIGVKDKSMSLRLNFVLKSICENIIWMSPESAEMTKHALNSFLATEIAFINEIALICEKTGADVRDVERGLKTDSRIGEKAYLKAGSSFAGGTLARDLNFLNSIEETCLISSVIKSNDEHKMWIINKLDEIFESNLSGKNIAILGLTYKPDTNTLRRSSSIELCKLLVRFGATIKVHDPSIDRLPDEYTHFNLCDSISETVKDVDVIVISTEWKIYRELCERAIIPIPVVIIDPNEFIKNYIYYDKRIKYYSVGRGNVT